MNVLSCFDGISCGQIALQRAGIEYDNYYASEIDKYAIKVTQANYPNTIQLGDITKWREWDLPKIDLIMGGPPCQGFSLAGKGLNFDDPRSKLFFTFIDILNHYQPKYFLLENVRMKKEWADIISKNVGVQPLLINSDLFIAQNRPRLYWTNIKNILLPNRPNWNEKYFQYRRTYFRENKSGVCPCLTANMGSGGHNVPLKSKDLNDKLTPLECEMLQTVPSGYTDHVSDTQRYKMLGNGWTVDVIKHILSYIKE